MGNNNFVANKFVGKEITKVDLNDPEKYNRDEILKTYDPMYAYNHKEIALIDEIVNMVKDCDDCSMEFKGFDKRHNSFIYRDKKYGNNYTIDWPVRHHDDFIKVIKMIIMNMKLLQDIYNHQVFCKKIQ